MVSADGLIGNGKSSNSRYCFTRQGELYLVYLPTGGTCSLDLSGVTGTFTVQWFNPRTGGPLVNGPVTQVDGGGSVSPGHAPQQTDEDWLIVIRRKP